tara:strand:+ start:307 stop:657 length:351 start_codon:yes stop_codon:yes gene_type:complete
MTTMTNDTTKSDLRAMVRRIADEISNGEYEINDPEEYSECCASDYLSDALDIRYIVSSDKEYLGAEILVAFGGPNIWIKTTSNEVVGYWGHDKASWEFTDNLGLDDYLDEYWDCLK